MIKLIKPQYSGYIATLFHVMLEKSGTLNDISKTIVWYPWCESGDGFEAVFVMTHQVSRLK